MKNLFFVFFLLSFGQTSNALKFEKDLNITSAQASIRQGIADCYNVSISLVSIVPYSSFTVVTPNATINGSLTLIDCGTDCTRVLAAANGQPTCDIVIVEDAEGI